MKTITYFKKNNAVFLLALFLLFSLKAISQEYCSPEFNSWSNLTCDNYRLREVNIGTIANDATSAACLTSDYLAMSTIHWPGETVDFSITLGNWMSFAIYADFNLDGDFDDTDEMLFAGNPEWVVTVETVTDSFIIPTDVAAGDYRMRVVAIWGDSSDNPPITAGQACEVFNREGSGNFHDYTLTIGETVPAECAFATLALTGFNHDIVAEGTGGNANEKATHPIDGANSFYAQDFLPTNPHSSGASAAAYGGGLPNNGTIASSATEGLTYQIADYNGNNGLVLRNTTTNVGTLALTEQKKAEKLYIAWVSAEGSNNVDVEVNFADGSSQTFTAQNASDWWSTSPNASLVAMGAIGRVTTITTASWSPVNSFSGLTQTQLFQTEFILDEANYNKLIESVSFTKETSSNDATTTAVIAMSICETQAAQVVPVVTVSTFDNVLPEIIVNDGTLQLEATVTPEEEDVTWSIVEGSEYALVSNSGLITALENGTITVRATLVSNTDIYDDIEVTISNQVVAVTDVTITVQDDAAAEITVENGTLQLVATTTPDDATNTDVTWTIVSGGEYATIDANGVVTAVANGTVTVRAASNSDDTIYDEIEVTISNQVVAVTDVTVTVQDDAAAEITVENGTLQLVATITPDDATNTDVTWTIVSGSEYATVDANGVVTAVANGTVTVRATSNSDDTVYAEIEVIINIPLSTINFDKSNFTVYPNPVVNILYIKSASQVVEVKLYNMIGQEVYTGTSSKINLQDLQAGYYVVQVRFENDTMSSVKIIKQ